MISPVRTENLKESIQIPYMKNILLTTQLCFVHQSKCTQYYERGLTKENPNTK